MRAKSTFSLLCVFVVWGLLSIGIWIMPVNSSHAAVPDSINYQGKLTRAGGPVNGTFDMVFSIYPDTLSGTLADWTEKQEQVEVEHGIFSVLLGSVNPMPAALFDGSAKYLGVEVGNDPEMRPLKPMVTTSYAFRSQEASQATNADMLDDLHGSDFVQISGDQNIDGIKTFSAIPVLPDVDPTSDNQATRKAYLDTRVDTRISIPANSAQGDLLYHNGSEWTRLPAGASGQFLKTQGVGDNPVWSVVYAIPPDNSVSQVKLKTSTGEVSTGSSWPGVDVSLPGGEYGFYPQIKMNSTDSREWLALLCAHSTHDNWHGHGGWTTYRANITLLGHGGTIFARQRYITSSGKDHWIFFLIDKNTRKVLASYQAPDHPCYGSGGDENDIPHPYGSFDPSRHEVILIDNGILPELKSRATSRRSLLTVINEDYEIDFDSNPVYLPREIIEIDEYGDKRGEILLRLRTPEWAKILIGKDDIFLRRRMVRTLPSHICYKKLKPKSNVMPDDVPILSQK